jgi:hypothetical protein
VFNKSVKGQLDGNPRVENNDLAADPEDGVAVVLLEKLANGLPAGPPDDLALVLQHGRVDRLLHHGDRGLSVHCCL